MQHRVIWSRGQHSRHYLGKHFSLPPDDWQVSLPCLQQSASTLQVLPVLTQLAVPPPAETQLELVSDETCSLVSGGHHIIDADCVDKLLQLLFETPLVNEPAVVIQKVTAHVQR